MHQIGMTNDGQTLVAMSVIEIAQLQRAAEVLKGIGQIELLFLHPKDPPRLTLVAADVRFQPAPVADRGPIPIADKARIRRAITAKRARDTKKPAQATTAPARRDRTPKDRDKVCIICKTTFKDESMRNNRNTCSETCRLEHHSRQNHKHRADFKARHAANVTAPDEVSCAQCGKKFVPAKHNQRICSDKCRAARHRQEANESYRRKHPGAATRKPVAPTSHQSASAPATLRVEPLKPGDKAARLELLKRLAAQDDPLRKADDTARRIHAEEA